MRKKLADIPVGKQISGDPNDLTTHDYSHVLPTKLRDQGYQLHVVHVRPLRPGESHGLHSVLYHPEGGEIGEVNGGFKVGRMNGILGGHAQIRHSKIDEAHRGKGLGLAMYEAFYSHAKNALGATHASSEDHHSSMASAVHAKMSKKHGMDYIPQKAPEADEVPSGPYDGKLKPYTYTLKSEDLSKSYEPDEILRLLGIPEERSLALKMNGCQDGHLAMALQHQDLWPKIVGHKSLGPITRAVIAKTRAYMGLWDDLLGSGPSLTGEDLEAMTQTCQGHDQEDSYLSKILGHPNISPNTVASLIDLAYHKALSHKAVEKATLDLFVHWHVEFPDQPIIAEMARAALGNPATSEHCYELALAVDDPATQMAVLQSGFYLPIKPAKDILMGCIYQDDEPLRMAIVNHPLVGKELLEIAVQDKVQAIRDIARAKLANILYKEGMKPQDVSEKLDPNAHSVP